MMRCVLLYMLDIMCHALLCLKEVFEVLEVMRCALPFMLDVLDVMRCVLLCMLEVVLCCWRCWTCWRCQRRRR